MAELTLEEIRALLEMREKLNLERKPEQNPVVPQRIACGHCGGRTSVLKNACPECGGKGYREVMTPQFDEC